MNKIINLLKENLEITSKEAKSTLTFLILTVSALTVYVIINEYSKNNSVSVNKILIPLENVNQPFQPSTPSVKVELKPFNPNTASLETFESLGIPSGVAKTIINYRNKGGVFRKKSDLSKIYALKNDLYEELEPYIDLPTEAKTKYESYNKLSPTTNTTKANNKAVPKFDINAADTTQLISLRGIGSIYASRIIKFRDALGGFHSLHQIDETFGLKPEAANIVKENAFVKIPVKKININTVENFKHPYLKAFQIKNILAYRNQHGPFASIEDLKPIKNLDEETLQKIAPYLSF